MKIAIASGKGGTGKTTLAVGLALALATTESVTLLDCDVDEPNAHLFLAKDMQPFKTVHVSVPQIDRELCTACGRCASVCRFNAIASIPSGPMTFPELCHACGGCAIACPTHAITEHAREVGILRQAHVGAVTIIDGLLHVGEAMSTPVIHAVKAYAPKDGLTLIDCPPGTACPMVAAVRGCDVAILVTEPTPFGLHDLSLAVETLAHMQIPCVVAVNRAGTDNRIRQFCTERDVPLCLEIPESRAIAEAYARGRPLGEAWPDAENTLRQVWQQIQTHEFTNV